MLKVKGTTVTMSRGDTISLNINVYDSEGKPYTLAAGDKLIFSAKAKATDKNYAIPPIELTGTTLNLDPADTYDLEFGSYLYDIQLVTANGKYNTIIAPSSLIIEPVITAYGDR